MRSVKFVSDYDPSTSLRMVETDDGDIVLRIRGDGEMRFAMSGGKLRGTDLVRVKAAFSEVITVLSQQADALD